MVRDEVFFLQKWIDYYSRFVPRENLYILVDGPDSTLPEDTQGCQIITFPKSQPGRHWDRSRWRFLSQFAGALTHRFDVVIGGDVDELIALDPDLGGDPIAYIAEQTTEDVISPFAIEIVHRVDLETPLAPTHPILDQRSFGRPNAFYCKPCIIRVPVQWSLGQHYSDYPRLHVSDALFLFHLRFVDRDILLDRQKQRHAHVTDIDSNLIDNAAGAGWAKSVDDIDDQLLEFAQAGPPKADDFLFESHRSRMYRRWRYENKRSVWKHAKFSETETLVIPERFKSLF